MKNLGDIDKIPRAVLDALTGIVYVDDKNAVGLVSSKVWGPEGVDVVVEIA
jgi:Holliday junction resolvase RusA-like endonuclease